MNFMFFSSVSKDKFHFHFHFKVSRIKKFFFSQDRPIFFSRLDKTKEMSAKVTALVAGWKSNGLTLSDEQETQVN